MFSLTKKADYGLSLLSALSAREKGDRMSLSDLADLGMPRAFAGKIASSLVEAGIINAKEGRGGGDALNYRPEEIQVKEVLEAVEGEVDPTDCEVCPVSGGCGQVGFMGRLADDINGVLERYTLADLIK